MNNIDWHADRGGVAILDLAPESDGINLRAVRRYAPPKWQLENYAISRMLSV